MEPRCTCGAILPSDARFCHKCGKPQYAEDIARIEAQESAALAPVQAPLEPPGLKANGISFKDGRAVAITFGGAILAFLGLMCGAAILPSLSSILFPIILLSVGFLVPAAYRRSTTQPLTAAAGARLGWMTGVWFFLGFLIVVALLALLLSGPSGSELLQQLQAKPQFAQMKIMTPHDLVMAILMSALPMFLLVTLLPGVGGMLGARFWGKGR